MTAPQPARTDGAGQRERTRNRRDGTHRPQPTYRGLALNVPSDLWKRSEKLRAELAPAGGAITAHDHVLAMFETAVDHAELEVAQRTPRLVELAGAVPPRMAQAAARLQALKAGR